MKQPGSREGVPHPSPGGALGASLKLWIVLSRAYESVARVAAADVAKHGLTIPEFGILEVLYHKGPILLGEVQRRVLVSSGGNYHVSWFRPLSWPWALSVERRSWRETDRRGAVRGSDCIGRIAPDRPHSARCMASEIARAVSGLSTREQRVGHRAAENTREAGAAALDGPSGEEWRRSPLRARAGAVRVP